MDQRPFALEKYKAFLALNPPVDNLDTIQQVVAREWGVTPDGLRSKTRTKQLTVPRQVAMYLCRELLALQLVEIGNAFGGRDHSTVIHAINTIEKKIEASSEERKKIEELKKRIEIMSM